MRLRERIDNAFGAVAFVWEHFLRCAVVTAPCAPQIVTHRGDSFVVTCRVCGSVYSW